MGSLRIDQAENPRKTKIVMELKETMGLAPRLVEVGIVSASLSSVIK